MGFFHNAKKQEAISVINDTVLVDLITPSIRGAKQFSVNFDEIRIDEPLDGEHETHGKGWNFSIFLRCDRAFAKKDTMETELTFAFAKFQKKYESKPILDRITPPEVVVAGNEGLIIKLFLASTSS